MNTTSKIVLGMTLAIITVPGLAAGTMSNSVVWTTTNGSAIVDSSGNAVRTIHYLEKTVAVTKETHKTTPSLIAAIKKAVAKVLNKEPDIVPEPAAQIVLNADPTPVIVEQEVAPVPVKEATVTVVEDEPETVEEEVVVVAEEEPVAVVEEPKVVEAPVVVTPVEPAKVEYSFNDYLATILFDSDSATLTAEGEGSLKQLPMATARAERVLSVQLFGYADSRGNHDYNMALSAKRMRSVEAFLSGQSLNVTSRFAKGESSPVLGAEGEDLVLSRRVDVAIKTRHIKD